MKIEDVFKELFGVAFYPRWSAHIVVREQEDGKLAVHLRPQHQGREVCVTLFTRGCYYSFYFEKDGLNAIDRLMLRKHEKECPDADVFDRDFEWKVLFCYSQYRSEVSISVPIEQRADAFVNAELVPLLPAIRQKMQTVSDANRRSAEAAERQKLQLSAKKNEKIFDALGL